MPLINQYFKTLRTSDAPHLAVEEIISWAHNTCNVEDKPYISAHISKCSECQSKYKEFDFRFTEPHNLPELPQAVIKQCHEVFQTFSDKESIQPIGVFEQSDTWHLVQHHPDITVSDLPQTPWTAKWRKKNPSSSVVALQWSPELESGTPVIITAEVRSLPAEWPTLVLSLLSNDLPITHTRFQMTEESVLLEARTSDKNGSLCFSDLPPGTYFIYCPDLEFVFGLTFRESHLKPV